MNLLKNLILSNSKLKEYVNLSSLYNILDCVKSSPIGHYLMRNGDIYGLDELLFTRVIFRHNEFESELH